MLQAGFKSLPRSQSIGVFGGPSKSWEFGIRTAKAKPSLAS